jgi:hypothetical protein
METLKKWGDEVKRQESQLHGSRILCNRADDIKKKKRERKKEMVRWFVIRRELEILVGPRQP